MARIASANVVFSRISWLPRGELTIEQWIVAGQKFGEISRCCQWWIGDWIRYGNAQWGEKYVEAARITKYDVGTLRNFAWIASQFEPSLRSDNLSWSHHALLAPLDEAEKKEWLRRAERDRLSVHDLRTELRAQKSRGSEQQLAGGTTVQRVCPHCGGPIPG